MHNLSVISMMILDIEDKVIKGPLEAMHNQTLPIHSESSQKILFHYSQSSSHFYRFPHSEIVKLKRDAPVTRTAIAAAKPVNGDYFDSYLITQAVLY
ncbi:hypothetical protein Tco_1078867 [Tanacetum coccineum]|uniref:Uncharacterized protein n=1 Tax=Tanacetum coccineum TaxID=301880 RepID=A0ABQ5HRS1_9ASTR